MFILYLAITMREHLAPAHEKLSWQISFFNSSTQPKHHKIYINSIFSHCGMKLKSRVPTIPHICSLIVQMEHSASLMCSIAAVVLHMTSGNSFFTFSNLRSIKIVCTLKPAHMYA
jgi:hypothetical protein